MAVCLALLYDCPQGGAGFSSRLELNMAVYLAAALPRARESGCCLMLHVTCLTSTTVCVLQAGSAQY